MANTAVEKSATSVVFRGQGGGDDDYRREGRSKLIRVRFPPLRAGPPTTRFGSNRPVPRRDDRDRSG